MTAKQAVDQAEAKLAPWVRNPCGLVSLWDMIAGPFGAQIAQFIESLVRVEETLNLKAMSGDTRNLVKDFADAVFDPPIKFAEPFAASFNLKTVRSHIERIRSEESFGVNPQRAAQLLRGLVERFVEELEHRQFFYIGDDCTDVFKRPWSKWGAVPDKFPSTRFDISEAGKCLIFDRGTAAVFHLMRVLGHGIRALGDDLEIPSQSNSNWSVQLDLIEKRVTKQMPPTDPKAVNRKFYQEAVMQFRLFKDAVRNHAMHELAMYNTAQAEGHQRAVNDFMQHLATRLSE